MDQVKAVVGDILKAMVMTPRIGTGGRKIKVIFLRMLSTIG
jgi:hypothetical protein